VGSQVVSAQHPASLCAPWAHRYQIFQAGALHGWIDRDLVGELPGAILEDPTRLFDAPGVELVREDRNRTARVELDDRVLWVKQFRPALAWVRYRFRSDKASRAWTAAMALRSCGISSPRPLLVLQGTGFRHWGQGLIAMEDIPDSDSLKSLWPRLEAEERRSLLTQLAHAAGNLHRHGFRHRDLNSTNILVTRPVGDEYEIHLIDVNRIRRYRQLDDEARLRDLVRLAVIDDDPEAFFCAYGGVTAGARLAAAYRRRRTTIRRLRRLPPPLGRIARKLWYYSGEIKGLRRSLPLLPDRNP
jgi:hypothetical protein